MSDYYDSHYDDSNNRDEKVVSGGSSNRFSTPRDQSYRSNQQRQIERKKRNDDNEQDTPMPSAQNDDSGDSKGVSSPTPPTSPKNKAVQKIADMNLFPNRIKNARNYNESVQLERIRKGTADRLELENKLKVEKIAQSAAATKYISSRQFVQRSNEQVPYNPTAIEVQLYLFVRLLCGKIGQKIETHWIVNVDSSAATTTNNTNTQQPNTVVSLSVDQIMMKQLGTLDDNYETAWQRYMSENMCFLVLDSLEWIRYNAGKRKAVAKYVTLRTIVENSAHTIKFVALAGTSFADMETNSKGRWTRVRESNDRSIDRLAVLDYFTTML